MLVKDLISHLQKMEENSVVRLEIMSKIDEEDTLPTLSEIDSIEFSDNLVTLKGRDTLVEWD